MKSGDRRKWATPVMVALLAIIVVLPSLSNGFVYDDVPVIAQNDLVHQLGASIRIWTGSSWLAGQLYRPLTLQGFNLEWTLGGGRPVVFHRRIRSVDGLSRELHRRDDRAVAASDVAAVRGSRGILCASSH